MYRPARPSGSLLVMTSPANTGAPPWFSAALAAAARERTTTFEGTFEQDVGARRERGSHQLELALAPDYLFGHPVSARGR